MPFANKEKAKEYRKEWKRKNRVKIRQQKWSIEGVKKRRKQVKTRNAQYVKNYKNGKQCLYCNESDPICLTFHHRDPKQKKFEISQHKSRSFSSLQIEIEKCDLVCSNCHLKLHHKPGFKGYTSS